MTKIVKIFATLLATLMIAVLIFINTVDVNQYKSDIINAVQQSTGRNLSIDGDINFSLLFVPSINVQDVKFSNADWGSKPDMLKVSKLELQVALLPLLHGEIQIKRLMLLAPDILLETNSKGIANWEFTAATSENKNETEAKKSTSISIDEIQIENATINYNDGATGQTTKLAIAEILAQTNALSDQIAVSAKALYNNVPLELSGNLILGEKTYALQDLNVLFDALNLSGSISADLSVKKPFIRANLDSELIDLRTLGSDDNQTKTQESKNQRLFSAQPLPLDGLKAVNANISLNINEIKTRTTVIKNTKLDAVLEDGLLTLQPISATLASGLLSGNISLNSRGKKASLTSDITIKGLQPSQIGELADRISGAPTDITFKANGSGNSVSQIMAGLNGQLLVQTGKGEIKGVGTKLASTDLFTMLNPMIEGGDTSSLTCSVINFSIKDGLATTDKGIALMMKQMDVVGSGTIDLKTEKLDISLKPHPREGLGLSMGQLADLVSIGGTLANPQPTTNLTSAVTTGLKVQTAVVTGGLSLLAQGLFDRVTADEDPCKTALAIKAVSASKQTEQTTPKESGRLTDKIKGLFR